MTDDRAARIADFIEPLRVRPGRKVHLARDFDPRHRSGPVKKKRAHDGNGHAIGRRTREAVRKAMVQHIAPFSERTRLLLVSPALFG